MTVDGLIMDAAICNSDFQFCNCPLCFFSWLTASLCSLCCNHGEWKINQISWEPRSAPLAGGDSLCIAARTCYRGWLLSVTSSFVRNLSLNIFLSSQIENLCRLNKPYGRTPGLGSECRLTHLFLFSVWEENKRRILWSQFPVSRGPSLRRFDILLDSSALVANVHQVIKSRVPDQHQILNMFKLDNSRPPPLHSLFDHNFVIRSSNSLTLQPVELSSSWLQCSHLRDRYL